VYFTFFVCELILNKILNLCKVNFPNL